jgi:DNA invertase Pin-like site-specific DNA recombinase
MTPAYALYRRSRTHQDLSVEEQRQEIGRWAAQHGYEIVREFADDRSGLDTERRVGFLAFLDVCSDPKRRAADVVLVYDISRFSRLEPDEAAFHEFSLRRTGVKVIYTHEPGANEAGVAGHLMKSFKRAMAHDYSLKLSQVVTRGLRAHAERGLWVGGQPAYGLRRAVRQPDGSVLPLPSGRWKARGETVVLMPDVVEARVLNEIYDAYVDDKGLTAVAAMLNGRGVPAPGGGAWTKGTLWAILRNPLYVGTIAYGKARYSEIGKKRGKARLPESEWVVVENAVPAILPMKLWAAAQAKHGTRKFGVGRPWHRPYLLSGLIVCGRCGKRFQAHKQSRGLIPAYYVCGSYLASGLSVCDGLRVSMPYIDDAVVDGIQKRIERVLDRDALTLRLQEQLRPETPAGDTVEALEARLTETKRRIGRLVEALAAGPDELPSVTTKLAELERDRRFLEIELARVRIQAAAEPADLTTIVDKLLDALSRLAEVLATGEPKERKALVRTFLQEITVEKTTGQATLNWYRLPRVNESLKLVELRGLEPLTPRLPALCSPN